MLLPPWVPLNIYDFACWARQTIVAADGRGRPRPVPAAAVRARRAAHRRAAAAPALARARGRAASSGSTGCCTRYERRPPSARAARSPATAAERWIVDRQEADGSWGGIQPPWVYSLIALHLARLPPRPPGDAAGLRRARPLHGRRRARHAPARGVPVAGVGHRAGRDRARRRRRRRPTTRRSCSAAELAARRGDRPSAATGRCAGRNLAPGGWAFEFDNDNYPDIDDTAEVVLALRRVARRGPEPCRPPSSGASRWIDRHAVPRRRLGRVRRRQHPRAVPPAAVLRLRRGHRPAQRRRHRPRRGDARRRGPTPARPLDRGRRLAVAGSRSPTARGSAAGAPTTSTAPAPPCPRSSPPARATDDPRLARAVAWLESSTRTPTAAGARTCAPTRGPDVARARRVDRVADGLGAAGAARRRRDRSDAVEPRRRVAGRDPARRRHAGTSPEFTGTGFPGDFYINYHLYRQVFPVMALGRYVRSTRR